MMLKIWRQKFVKILATDKIEAECIQSVSSTAALPFQDINQSN